MISWRLFGEQTVRQFVQANPLLSLTDWWHFLLTGILLIGLVGFSVYLVIRDRSRQSIGVVLSLLVLRLALIAVVVIFFLNHERKNERVSITASRVAVLIDNSLSMELPGQGTLDEKRFDQAKRLLMESSVWQPLTDRHDVHFYSLSEQGRPIELGRVPRLAPDQAPTESKHPVKESLQFGIWILGLGLLLYVSCVVPAMNHRSSGMVTLSGTLLLIAGCTWIGLSYVADPAATVWGQNRPAAAPDDLSQTDPDSTGNDSYVGANRLEEVESSVPHTALCETVSWFLNQPDNESLAAIFVLSDGRDTTGQIPDAVAQKAQSRSVQIVTIGFGSSQQAANLQILDVDAPRKIFRGDRLTIRGRVRASGTTGQHRARLTLTGQRLKGPDDGVLNLEAESKEVAIEAGGVGNFGFEVSDPQAGLYRFQLDAEPLEGELNTADNRASIEVEVIDRSSRVLLFAGGPSREFRFLRDQLYRDPNVDLHVLLQSAQEDSYQESDQMLHRFPEDKNRFREYDCVVAFDPDWTALSPAQTEMVRSWVADDSGGLIVVAGPVNTPKWSSRPRGDSLTEPIRRLYPVSFFGQSSGSIRLGRFGGEESFPLQFTRQAEAFDFLKFDADPETNRKLWDRVRVFGYYAVNEEKAGAQVIAHFSDPLTAFGNRQPIYLAAQMYGSGRVFFQASGELWRTRGLGPEFFEQYYTRLIRWTSQGRLYRNDLPWKLSLDRESCTVGEFVNIRATPNREHPELIRRDALPVTHVYPLATPGGTQERSTINLSPMIEGQDEAGFGARVRIQQAGTHRFQLVVGSGDESSIIEVSLVAKIPNLELQDSRRNDDLLEKFAETSGGKYLVYSGAETIDSLKNVHQAIPDHTVENVASLTDDINFKQKSHFALFAGFVVFLVVGWIMRRLNQLA